MNQNIEKKKVSYEIPVEELFRPFSEHLCVENNHRIFFSGKFGIGKTFFLHKFFESKRDEYEIFHLFPVNYQISENNDIIELLKYDILVELIKKNTNIIKKNDYSSLIDLQRLLYLWGRDNLKDIFYTGIALIPKLGRPMKEIVNLIDGFYQFKKEMELGEKGQVDQFFEKMKGKNIAETDYLSELIKEKVRLQKGEKKSVLILDDLDRIDPEHIFRVLNVFSAHLNLDTSEDLPNKFEFDKVILVGSEKNIESIFNHQYGENTDFDGYFNKFYSYHVFELKNEDLIAASIDILIKMIRPKDNNLLSATGEHGFIYIFLRSLLKEAVYLDTREKVNLRQLLKMLRFSDQLIKEAAYKHDLFLDNNQQVLRLIDCAIRMLINISDGKRNLIKILTRIKTSPKDTGLLAFQIFSPVLAYETIPGFNPESEDDFNWNQYKLKKVIKNGSPTLEVINKKEGSTLKSLFCDLLISYVTNEKYLKKTTYEYQQ